MSELPRVLQGAAVAWDTSFCVSLKEYAPVANGKQQKLKTIAGIVRSFFFFFKVVMSRQVDNSTYSSKQAENSLEHITTLPFKVSNTSHHGRFLNLHLEFSMWQFLFFHPLLTNCLVPAMGFFEASLACSLSEHNFDSFCSFIWLVWFTQ